jgi:hypothetical protein
MTQNLHLSRRGLVVGMGALALAGRALAAPAPQPKFPLRIAVFRMSEKGLAHIPTEHQTIWNGFATRLGGLVDTIEPAQPISMVDLSAPADDGGESSAARARGLAERMGCGHIILYATDDGVKRQAWSAGWVNRAFNHLREAVAIHDRQFGEALLMDIQGGLALAQSTADVSPSTPIDLFTGRNGETETLKLLTAGLERRVQKLAEKQRIAEQTLAD